MLERYAFEKFPVILINNSDFKVNKFNIFRRIFSIEINVTLSNKKSRFTSLIKEVIKVIFLANEARDARL